MDTRSKITTVNAIQEGDVEWVAGYFDPLLTEQIRRLRSLKRDGAKLGVIVRNPPTPLLSQRARAELVAALGIVDYVLLDDAGVQAHWLDDLPVRGALCSHILQRERDA